MRRQLRPFHTDLSTVYTETYNHAKWPDHVARVARTAELLRSMRPTSVADLSCGDAGVVIQAGYGGSAILGDLMPGYRYHGPIEQTIDQIEPVDVFVLSETLEHVEDPDGLLRAIRGKAKRLIMSTPVGEDHDLNPQHYWGWDVSDVEEMLEQAGWTGEVELCGKPGDYYTFQIWRCR